MCKATDLIGNKIADKIASIGKSKIKRKYEIEEIKKKLRRSRRNLYTPRKKAAKFNASRLF